MESIYSFSTTSKTAFQNKLYMLNRISKNCNKEIIHIKNINKKWSILENFLKKNLNDDVINNIKKYVNFKMNGDEIKWIIDNSDTTYPFECRGCCNFLKIKLKYEYKELTYFVSMIKEKYCIYCKDSNVSI